MSAEVREDGRHPSITREPEFECCLAQIHKGYQILFVVVTVFVIQIMLLILPRGLGRETPTSYSIILPREASKEDP